MYTEIATALSTLKTMSDLTALILKTKVDSAVTQKAIESQTAIISLQSAMLGLQSQYQQTLEQNELLKNQLAEIENWHEEATKYSLTEIAPRVLVYALKPEYANGTPIHWLCAHCYSKNQKGFLQRTRQESEGTYYGCTNCRTEIVDWGDCLPPIY